jgi:hypothetical protein
MSRLPFVLLLLGLLPASAAAQNQTNALTPKEIAEGWILLFDGETTFGWKTEGEVKVEDGFLVVGGNKPASVTATTGFLDFELAYEVHQRSPGWFLIGWEAKDQKKLGMKLSSTGQRSQFGGTYWGSKGKYQAFSYKGAYVVAGEKDWGITGVSHCTLATGAGTKVAVRNFKLRPLGLKSIFNGKDLAGWREFPGKKSKFSVNPAGELLVKNGPGDLQTEGSWGDFVLQFECLSNGKHLNSGVFFRCRPSEYQNGYEAQIRNQFVTQPQSYTIDDYDPTTHKKVGSHKVKSPAIDYGTGAIYRRQPARKQMSFDHEWFTMTVVPQGNHFSTWVNGYQEADWIDNRSPSDNARTGFRRAAGPLSLQGHDPTTDLNFRNLRIAELR